MQIDGDQLRGWIGRSETRHDVVTAAPLAMLSAPRAEADSDSFSAIDIVVNASSASLAGAELEIHGSWFERVRLAYDMMYGPSATPFMCKASAAGAAEVADGLGMLVEQAAEAFALWRGVRPETASVLAELRLQLAPTQP